MEVDYGAQFALAAVSLAAGLFLGVLYDVMRLVRAPFGKAGVFMSDLSFCVIFTLSVAVLLYNYWSGKLRVYPFLLCFCGLVVYRLTLGRLTAYIAVSIKRLISPRLAYLRLAVKGYILRRKLLAEASRGFGIRLKKEKRECQEEQSRT